MIYKFETEDTEEAVELFKLITTTPECWLALSDIKTGIRNLFKYGTDDQEIDKELQYYNDYEELKELTERDRTMIAIGVALSHKRVWEIIKEYELDV